MAASIALFTIAAVALGILLLALMVWMRVKSYQAAGGEEDTPADGFSAAGFSLVRYEPMLRLLSAEDGDFLRRQTNCPPEMVTRWERDRRRIFRVYLNDLSADFRRLHARARALVAESPEQYSGLVDVLIRQQVTFWRAMAAVELRLALSRLGLARVDARRLIEALEAMHTEVLRLAPAAR